ncbi:hypothetical protein QUF74_05505 [Candidatus Halobeggiatoa sp. HSG11]|nr:hypothetical protein [Candidatus Halobeggiatoa sp. HSG11]
MNQLLTTILTTLMLFSFASSFSYAVELQPNETHREEVKTEKSDRKPALVFLIQIVDSNENPVSANVLLNEELVCENSSDTTLMLPAQANGTILEVQAAGYETWKVELNYKVNNYLEKPLLVQLKSE